MNKIYMCLRLSRGKIIVGKASKGINVEKLIIGLKN